MTSERPYASNHFFPPNAGINIAGGSLLRIKVDTDYQSECHLTAHQDQDHDLLVKATSVAGQITHCT